MTVINNGGVHMIKRLDSLQFHISGNLLPCILIRMHMNSYTHRDRFTPCFPLATWFDARRRPFPSISYLVGGFNPSEKYMSIGMIIPNRWENKKSSKPPTSCDFSHSAAACTACTACTSSPPPFSASAALRRLQLGEWSAISLFINDVANKQWPKHT